MTATGPPDEHDERTDGAVSASAALTPDAGAAALLDALDALRARLGALRLPLETPGVHHARTDLARATDQLDDYLLPRLRAERAPLLVVVGGSTGAGKSTLVNSLLGEQATAPGVLRPTTRAPVLVHHPLDARWFTGDRVLPGLARTSVHGTPPDGARDGGRGDDRGPAAGPRALRLVASSNLPQGLALLDAPDVDSVEEANRDLATQLLGAADLWLFVTTAARYADAVPWELLTTAAARRAQVALVLDRVDPGTEEVATDLRRLMTEHGLAEAALFVVPEAGPGGETVLSDGLLPEQAVGELATWLTGLGGDPDSRARVIAATRDGVVDDLVRRANELAGTADVQHAADARLRDVVERHHADALRQVEAATSDGALLRGEVLARWQDFIGTGEFFRSLEARAGKVRDAVVRVVRGRPKEAPQVERAIAHGLESVVLDAAEQAAERTYAAWRDDAAGAGLLDGLELSRTAPGLRPEVAGAIRAWQGDVLELVREQGESRRGTARALSLGVNALGVSLMVVVFASTAGLTGLEVGIAGGTAVVAQKLLEAVFGDDAVRRLAAQAKERLTARVDAVLRGQSARYTAQLDALGTDDVRGDRLRDAARDVAAAARDERATRSRADDGLTRPWSGGMLRGAGTFRPPTSPEGIPGVPGSFAGRGSAGQTTADAGGPEASDEPKVPFWRRWRRKDQG
ncbi:dynamin family protein [Isoptericola sp. CG 20/1183]|uniref:Dynamin family protein n=1 Tax=Isoptericola halotolerans TaxID=300560 RepID=A0ABX5EH68_9MICO|nr:MULTISPECIES: dynamin family protein [Isoptericola]PRZ07585.1 dynamin family protein [Isoptericola halotolerans]PRZ08055.1 dynamin family protein [Isoptericola sp. CG 20/1183]